MVRHAWLAAFLLVGCFETTPEPPSDGGPGRDAGPGVDAGPPPPPPNDLDLLVVMDDSPSTSSEQYAFVAQLPWLLDALLTGDVDGDGVPDEEPFDSLHFGVVTSDMGVAGHEVFTCDNGRYGRDGVLSTRGRADVPDCEASYPSFLDEGYRDSTEELAQHAACLATVGTGGCGFEQPLEATLKALSSTEAVPGVAPGYEPPVFWDDTGGNGDVENAGFLRPDSLLAVLLMAVEDDCSASDPDLYDADSDTYTDDLNLRCFTYEREALHAIDRYVGGLLQLRRYPNHLVFVPIAGVPAELATVPGEPTRWDPLVSPDPEVRDDRLEVRVDPSNPSRVAPSCSSPGTGIALPPVRILQTAEALHAAGASVAVGSLCTEDARPAFEAFYRLLRP